MKNKNHSIKKIVFLLFLFLFGLQITYAQLPKIEGNILGIGFNNQLYLWEGNGWKHIPNSGLVVDIAVMDDGTVLGIGKNQQLYLRGGIPWKSSSENNDASVPSNEGENMAEKRSNNQLSGNLSKKWKHIPNSGNVFSVAIAKDKSILGVGNNKQIYKWEKNGFSNTWKLIPNTGKVMDISIMNDGTIVGVGMDKQLYLRKNNKWEKVPNSGSVIDVAVTKNGLILGVGVKNEMYVWVQTALYSSWKLIPNSKGIVAIATAN